MSSTKKIFDSHGAVLLSAKAASKRMKCAPDYVTKLCREGKLDGKFVDGAWLVSEVSIIAFEKIRKEAKAQRSKELAEQRKRESADFKKAIEPVAALPAAVE